MSAPIIVTCTRTRVYAANSQYDTDRFIYRIGVLGYTIELPRSAMVELHEQIGEVLERTQCP